jgi:ABC-type multidrug transport system ATPase subunit
MLSVLETATGVVSSHLLAEMEHLADDVAAINRGMLVTTGTLQALQHTDGPVRAAAQDQLAPALIAAGGTGAERCAVPAR